MIVLDMDGVLINTLPHLKRAFKQFLEDFGGTYSEGLFNRFNGNNLREIILKLKLELSLEESFITLEKHYKNLIKDIHKKAILNKGAFNTINLCMRWGVDICLVTGASKNQVFSVLQKNKIENCFAHIVSGDDVGKGKPDPDLFLKLKEKYPRNKSFYVFDDAINGVLASEKAGMEAFLFGHSKDEKYKSVKNFEQISQYILKQILNDKVFINAENCKIISKHSKPLEAGAVNDYWLEYKLKHPNSFNGSFLTVTDLQIQKKEIQIKASCVDYKQMLFMKEFWPTLKSIHPFTLAISAIVSNNKGEFLIGRRKNTMNNYPGYYELAGSGNLTCNNNPEMQLIAELNEECDLKIENLKSIKFIGLSVDHQENIIDLCYKVTAVNCDIPNVTDEYEELNFISKASLKNFVKSKNFVPSSLLLLSFYI